MRIQVLYGCWFEMPTHSGSSVDLIIPKGTVYQISDSNEIIDPNDVNVTDAIDFSLKSAFVDFKCYPDTTLDYINGNESFGNLKINVLKQ
jgi:hypothetical protein